MATPLRLAIALAATAGLTFLLLSSDPLALLGFPPRVGRDVAGSFLSDKIQHAVSYAILTACLCAPIGRRSRDVGIAAALALMHGAATELLQTFVPDRCCDAADFVANAIGVSAASLVILIVVRWRSRRAIRWLDPTLPEAAT